MLKQVTNKGKYNSNNKNREKKNPFRISLLICCPEMHIDKKGKIKK